MFVVMATTNVDTNIISNTVIAEEMNNACWFQGIKHIEYNLTPNIDPYGTPFFNFLRVDL